MLAHVYDKDGFYVRSENCPIDPLESERTEALVWLAPADATLKTPPAFSSGQWPRWTGEDWELVEDHRVIRNEQGEVVSGTAFWLPGDSWDSPARYMDKPGPLLEGAMLSAPERSQADIRREEIYRRMAELESWLDAHDYIGTKIITGRATREDYAAEIETMSRYAEELSAFREELKALEAA
ncbi:hypothetical protein [Mailhella massiliensis]|uniref:hypothetical protein n=1 Tax=Mailhella massiliensis TaxID=1903261 RepID=UPI0023549692|nr:hypothetical protein [Mailhella massiliensis]